MILKSIRLTARPGCRDELLLRQRVWNEAMSRQPGFLGVRVATDPGDPDRIQILAFFATYEALDRFMAGDHDVVERETAMSELYERCEVEILEVVDSAPLPDSP